METRTEGGHMILDGSDPFRLALFDDRLAGYAQLLRKDVNAHFLSQDQFST